MANGRKKRNEDWIQVARSDPEIVRWFTALTQGTLRLDDMGPLMKRDKSYDYKSAIEAGIRPSLQPDGLYHWPSWEPKSGKKLKAKGHPTENKALGPLGFEYWSQYLR